MAGSSKSKILSPVSVRLSPEERAELEQAAAGTSLSAHIRECLFGTDTGPRKHRRHRVATADEESLARVLGLLGQSRIANNLNQLAKSANMGRLVWNSDAESRVTEAYDHINSMRDELIRALGLREHDRP